MLIPSTLKKLSLHSICGIIREITLHKITTVSISPGTVTVRVAYIRCRRAKTNRSDITYLIVRWLQLVQRGRRRQ